VNTSVASPPCEAQIALIIHDQGASVRCLAAARLLLRGSPQKVFACPLHSACRSFSPQPSATLTHFFPPPASRFIVRPCCGTTWTNRGESCAALFSKFTSSCKRRFAARLLWQPRPSSAPSCAIHSLAPKQHQHTACTAITTAASLTYPTRSFPEQLHGARFIALANCLPRSRVNTRSPHTTSRANRSNSYEPSCGLSEFHLIRICRA
jgi:hypothetical protein